MADLVLRCITAAERDAVLDLLAGWLDRAFFARYFAHDPTFRDDLCFVATVGGRPVSTLQVFRKTVQVDGARLAVAAVGNVYTDPAHRGAGVASALLAHALPVIAQHDFDVSLLFATRLAFYGRFGWRSVPRALTFVAAGGGADAAPALEPFDRARDLAAVRAVYEAYNAGVPGAVVRDAAYWDGQLHYAGNPGERFVVARRAGSVIAYARATTLYDLHVVHEHGCRPGETAALAALIAGLHAGAPPLPGTLLQVVPDPALADALAARDLALHTVDDGCWMWRAIDAERLAARLRLPMSAVQAEDFFTELLPATRSRYWLSDRF